MCVLRTWLLLNTVTVEPIVASLRRICHSVTFPCIESLSGASAPLQTHSSSSSFYSSSPMSIVHCSRFSFAPCSLRTLTPSRYCDWCRRWEQSRAVQLSARDVAPLLSPDTDGWPDGVCVSFRPLRLFCLFGGLLEDVAIPLSFSSLPFGQRCFSPPVIPQQLDPTSLMCLQPLF